MNNNITKWSNSNGDIFEIFNFDNLGRVQTIKKLDGSIWFCNNDVCRILEIQNPRDIFKRTGISLQGVDQIYGLDSRNRRRLMTYIDKGNLFMLITRSDKPQARRFHEWVCREVLVKLSDNGYYNMPNMTTAEMLHHITGNMMELEKQTQLNTQVLNDHGNQIQVINNNIDNFNKQIKLLSDNGYFTISSVLKYRNIPASLDTVQTLGSNATRICEYNNIPVASIPHEMYGYIHAYPLNIINDVINKHFGN